MPTNTLSFSPVKLEPFQYPELAKTAAVKIASTSGVQTFAKGTALAIVDADYTVVPYDNSGSGGADVGRMILAYDITVNTTALGGGITYTATTGAVGGPMGETYKTVPAYVGGCFHTADLKTTDGSTALTSTALTDFLADVNAKIIGEDATGLIFIF